MASRQSDSQEDLDQPGQSNIEDSRSVGLTQTQNVRLFDQGKELALESGQTLSPIDVAYETYGRLNDKRDNAILIVHALSGSAHVAGRNKPDDKYPGWWDILVGPQKPIDTDRYFVICSNALGGCMGTTGPTSINPKTNRHYGLSFPMITISDMVDLQKHLIDHLGIEKLLAVIGGSMGGMQVLDWAIRYPERLVAAIPIASTARLSAQSIAFDAVGRNAILRDKNFQQGTYYNSDQYPHAGLAIARMVAHITYLSEEAMHAKFGRRLQHARDYKYDFESEFSVETYLDYQGSRFVDRFDANTYLYFSKAMDYFDLTRQFGDLNQAMSKTQSAFLVISYDSDWLFPPSHSKEMVNALIANNKSVTYCDIHSSFGHDSFLLEMDNQGPMISGFLRHVHDRLQTGTSAALSQSQTLSSGHTHEPKNVAAKRSKGSIFEGPRVDHTQIETLIAPNNTVLDLGCGDGELMQKLRLHKNICGMGVTLGQDDIINCTNRGVNVVQYDLDEDLGCFGDQVYDTVVLSQTLQVVRRPEIVLREMLRIAKQAIVSFPNFAYWRYRFQMMNKGRAPIGKALPHTWYDKTSVNYLSIADFEDFVRDQLGARIVTRIALLSKNGKRIKIYPNFFADEAIFVIANK